MADDHLNRGYKSVIPRDWFTQVEPRLIRREDGGWLAVSPNGAPLSIGVAAWTVEGARNAFTRAVREWGLLLAEPQQRGGDQ